MRPVHPTRRTCLGAAGLAVLPGLGSGIGLGLWPVAAQALAPRELVFPRDHGAHPDLRTEWWYLTGRAQAADGREFGFQLTFFRSRVDVAQQTPGRFAPRQLLFAHSAITDVAGQRLLHDQRIARWDGQRQDGSAWASLTDTRVRLNDWSLLREAASGTYRARLPGDEVGLALDIAPTQPLLLQGDRGLSRKGPDAVQASHYYTQPQLAVQGELTLRGQRVPVTGRAWLDHEWSEALLHPEAVGWDWIGMNLDDGSALTAFQLRRRDGSALWAGGSWRAAAQAVSAGQAASAQSFSPQQVRFEPLRHWTSAATRARYPVAWAVHTPVGRYSVQARVDAQELDARGSTGTVYWEGLSDLRDLNDAQDRTVGRGYLEMTGYAAPLQL